MFLDFLLVGIVDHVLGTKIKLIKSKNTLGLICLLNILNQFFRSVLGHLIILLVFDLSVLFTFFLVL